MPSVSAVLPPPPRTLRADTPPRRIALFTGNYHHVQDGVSLTLNRLVAFLQERGDEVLVFGPTVDDPPMDHVGRLISAPSLPAPGRPEYRLAVRFSRTIRKRLAAFQPDLVHIATPDYLGYRALGWAKEHGVPVVASYHTHFPAYLKYYGIQSLEGFLWKYARWFYGQCEHVYVPSLSVAAVLRVHGITAGLRLWERGVDTSRFGPQNRDLEWRRGLGIDDDDVLVAFVGRLVLEKGLSIFADVVEGLQARGLPIRSVMVGEGPARATMEGRLPGTVFTGYLGGDALPRAYASSDVFLFPSDTETFGNVTLEAMASGLPAVCADATGASELVQHGTTGYLAPPGDSEAFRSYVDRLVASAERRTRMGEAAIGRADHYDWTAVLARLRGYYEDALAHAVAA
jgi:glycosyltransferase involved in cell wall biosynthesis